MSALLPKFLPLLDPEHFDDRGFYRELEALGVEAVLLGGTGSTNLHDVVAMVRRETKLRTILYPAGPDAVCSADLVLLPDVMNSNSHFARPFGSGSVATAMAVHKRQLPYLPIAYFILGDSTARWYFDAFRITSEKLILGYCTYAKMVGYRHIALDYEDPELQIDVDLVHKLKTSVDLHLTISDEVDPEGLAALLERGADTVVIPSDMFESTADPVALIHGYQRAASG